MWISTSHLLITSYRSLIGNLEKRLSQGLEHSRGSGSGRGRYRTGEGGDSSGPVELRKLLARFQGFLNGEIGWYKSAIGEWVRVFGLEGVEGVIGWLGVVGISVVDDRDPSIPRNTIRHKLGVEEQEKKLGLIHKALICLGDLERYKDQYGAERERRKRVGGDDKERYGGAKKFYEVARGLLPDNGESRVPSHGVIIRTGKSDSAGPERNLKQYRQSMESTGPRIKLHPGHFYLDILLSPCTGCFPTFRYSRTESGQVVQACPCRLDKAM